MILIDFKNHENSTLFKILCISIFLFGFFLFYSNAIKNLNYSSKDIQLDFPAYYIAGTSISKGLSPYDNQNTLLISNELGIPYTEFRSFLYPPQSLLLFKLLANYPLLESQHIFTLSKEIVLLISIIGISYYISRNNPKKDFKAIKPNPFFFLGFLGLALLLGTILWPFKNDFLNGQINIIIFGLLCFSFIAAEKYPILSGFFLSIGILIKLSPILIVPYFLFRSNLLVIFSTLVFGIFLTFFSIYSFGIDLHIYYLNNLLFGTVSGDTISNLGWPYSVVHNQSIKGIFHRIFVSDYLDPHFGTKVIFNSPVIGKLLSTCIVIYFVYVLIKATFPAVNKVKTFYVIRSIPGLNLNENFNSLIFGLYLSGSLLISPLSWVHHKVLLLFPILVCLHKTLIVDIKITKVIIYLILLFFSVLLLSINHLYPYNQLPILGIFVSYIHLIGNLLLFLICYSMLDIQYG